MSQITNQDVSIDKISSEVEQLKKKIKMIKYSFGDIPKRLPKSNQKSKRNVKDSSDKIQRQLMQDDLDT